MYAGHLGLAVNMITYENRHDLYRIEQVRLGRIVFPHVRGKVLVSVAGAEY
jgi:hypothetical protein